ncbi:MAG: ScyD/ScyE family protein [Phycisphaerales bacterium]|nr:ScyD/ScyE family protein [Phycisphaerales bacterium]
MRRSLMIAAALPLLAAPVAAVADNPEVLASGLVLPIGLNADAEGRIWISEIGPPADGLNSSLSYFAPATGWTKQAYITDLPTLVNPANGEPAGAHCISFSEGGLLMLSIGGGPSFVNPQLGGVSFYDISDAMVAGGPYTATGAAYIDTIETWSYAVGPGGFNDSNVYSAVDSCNGELFIVDSGGNAVVRWDGLGIDPAVNFSTFASFDYIKNPKGGLIESVPTRIIELQDTDEYAFAVTELTGVPFLPGTSTLWLLDWDGNKTALATGLQTIVNGTMDNDGSFLLTSAGSPGGGPAGFEPGTGKIYRVTRGGDVSVVLAGLTLPTGITVKGDDIYYTEMTGTLSRYRPFSCNDADFNGDGEIDGADLGLLISAWGTCVP